jgi:hypothetical protein
MGHILYDEVVRYNPKNPYWFNRVRFVLSADHDCMLQYALLHLAGYTLRLSSARVGVCTEGEEDEEDWWGPYGGKMVISLAVLTPLAHNIDEMTTGKRKLRSCVPCA